MRCGCPRRSMRRAACRLFIRSVFAVFVEQRNEEEKEEGGGGTKQRATGPSDSIVNETGRRIVQQRSRNSEASCSMDSTPGKRLRQDESISTGHSAVPSFNRIVRRSERRSLTSITLPRITTFVTSSTSIRLRIGTSFQS